MMLYWTRAGLSWRVLLGRVWHEMVEDDVFGRSAELAYYFLFSLFPLLLFLTSVFAQIMGSRGDLRVELFEYLEAVIPSRDTLTLVKDTLQEIIDHSGLPLSFGLALSLWSAAQGVAALGRVLDSAYDVGRRRSWWTGQFIAVSLTVGCAVLALIGLALLFYGTVLVDWLATQRSWGQGFVWAWSWLQWPVVLLFVVLAFELIYNFAPSEIVRRRLHWTSPGSVIGVGLWLLASLVLKTYLTRFQLYNWAYGSLGGLTLLLLWFYLTGFALLVGGEINSEISKALAELEAGEEAPPPAPRNAAARPARRRRRGSR